jgi:hypothetical protein
VSLGESLVAAEGRVAVGADDGAGRAELTGRFVLAADEPLLTALPPLRELIERHAIAGRVAGTGRLSGDRRKVEIDCELDATALATALPGGGAKPAGLPAKGRVVATVRPGESTVQVRHGTGQVGSVGGIGDAKLIVATDHGGGPPTFQSLESHFRLWTSRAEDLPKLFPAAAVAAPRGDVEIHGEAYLAPSGAGLKYATVTFERFSVNHRGRRVTLDGSVLAEGVNIAFDAQPVTPERTWLLTPAAAAGGAPTVAVQRVDQLVGDARWSLAAVAPTGRPIAALTGFGRIAADGLRLSAGPSDAVVVMDLRDLLGSPEGAVSLLAKQIDPDDLQKWLAEPRELPEGSLTPAELATLDARAGELLSLVAQLTRRADVRFDADVKLLRNWPDVATGRLLNIHNLAIHTSIKAGAVAFEYQGGFSGGTLIDTYNVDLTEKQPKLAAVQRGLNLMASKELQPQIDILFPGNQLSGSMRRRIETTVPLHEVVGNLLDPRRPAYVVGTGKGVFLAGVTLGRAAPRFVTRVFPGLNLVEYPYDRMVNFSEYRPDGSVYNDMIFDGKVYDLYVEGVTDAQSDGRYDVGMILLGSPQTAEWNHRYRQGRVPVLKFRAKLIGGKKIDERISYPWPNETMFEIFLNNNYFYRLWLAGGK